MLDRVVIDLPAPILFVADLPVWNVKGRGVVQAQEIEAVILRQRCRRASQPSSRPFAS